MRVGLLAVACVVCGLSISAFFRWDERAGVYDAICYQRQAHLFQRFGLSGIDTNLARDDDGFFREAQRAIGLPVDADPPPAVCHPKINDKHVLQYPPGTGFLMSAFPEGQQAAWLYTFCTLIVMGATMFVVAIASLRASVAVAGLFGIIALYFMVSPTKASYSMAPTMAACIVSALLTPVLFVARSARARLATAAAIGLILGLSVSLRTPNVLLVAGYVAVLGYEFMRRRDAESFQIGAGFAAAYSLGIAPSLIANYVNAGSPFKTTYGPGDNVPADFTFSILGQYINDMQFYLALLAIAVAVWLARKTQFTAAVIVVGINLAVSLGFFFTHPIATQYYLMPIVTFALWSLLALWLLEQRYLAGSAKQRPATE